MQLHAPASLRTDTILKTALLVTLTAVYALVLFTLVVAVIVLPFGSPRELFAPPDWAVPAVGYSFVIDLLLVILLGPSAGVAAVAAFVVLLTLRPAYRWLRSGVNALIDANYDDAYAVVNRLDPHLRAMNAQLAVLPTIAAAIATAIAQALKLPYVAIRVDDLPALQGEEPASPLLAEWGTLPDGAEMTSLPLMYQDAAIGELRVSERRARELLSQSDLRILNDIARQVAISLYAARMTTDLQRSRMRLVTAREEERRRIRRDLHDGLGPTLANFAMQLEQAREHLPPEAIESEAVLAKLAVQAQGTIAEIRRLVYDLRPPDLDEFGLVSALREYLHRIQTKGTAVALDAPSSLPALPAAVEVATYRIVQEAVNNALKHAQPRRITVVLAVEPAEGKPKWLRVAVTDDGGGLPASHPVGIGLHSMRERAEELGGSCTVVSPVPGGEQGTAVTADLPLTFDSQ